MATGAGRWMSLSITGCSTLFILLFLSLPHTLYIHSHATQHPHISTLDIYSLVCCFVSLHPYSFNHLYLPGCFILYLLILIISYFTLFVYLFILISLFSLFYFILNSLFFHIRSGIYYIYRITLTVFCLDRYICRYNLDTI